MEYEVLTEITQTRGKEMKRIGHTEFKYVCIVSYDGVKTYRAEIPIFGYQKCFADARKAAIEIDKEFLKHGKNPVNILKKSEK